MNLFTSMKDIKENWLMGWKLILTTLMNSMFHLLRITLKAIKLPTKHHLDTSVTDTPNNSKNLYVDGNLFTLLFFCCCYRLERNCECEY